MGDRLGTPGAVDFLSRLDVKFHLTAATTLTTALYSQINCVRVSTTIPQ